MAQSDTYGRCTCVEVGGKTQFFGGRIFLFLILIFLFSIFNPECGIAQLSLSLFVSLSWSTSMTSIIFLFELVHLNDLLCDEYVDDIVEDIDVKWVLKSTKFDLQKADAPKIGVEFRQGSIGAISSSIATSSDVWRRRTASPDKSV